MAKIQKLSAEYGGEAGDFATFGKGSYDIARLAVGGVLEAVDAVMEGRTEGGREGGEVITNAYCLVRPPGHHAERDRGMGFCLFNNVALGALHAQAKHGVKRMAIVDYDVHHGNGTQASTSSNRARPSLPPPYCISFAFFFCLIRHQRQIKRFSLSSPPSLPPSLTASLLQGPLRALHLHSSG